MLHNSFSKGIFPNIQSKPPLMQLEAIASHPIAGYLGEESNTCLTTPSCQGAVESDKVPPQPPLFQTEQPQLPQPLLIRLVLQTPPQALHPPLPRDPPQMAALPTWGRAWGGSVPADPSLPAEAFPRCLRLQRG